jgi:hypothetical protein
MQFIRFILALAILAAAVWLLLNWSRIPLLQSTGQLPGLFTATSSPLQTTTPAASEQTEAGALIYDILR